MLVRVAMSPLPTWEIMTLIMGAVFTGRAIQERRKSLGLGFKNKD